MFDLSGKTALVTGSGRGLGLTFASALAGAGAKVILNGRNRESLEKATIALGEKGLAATCSVFNVYEEEEVKQAVGQIESRTGPIDILINNAGINLRNLIIDTTLADWNEVMKVNLTGPFLVAREVARGMIARRRGKIINICSLMSELGRSTTAAYTAAKGGLKMLTRAMTVEWAKYNIQVNAIGPGYFLTEMTRPLAEDQDFNRWITGRTPAGRWGLPEELAGVAVFLASEASNFVNGQVIYVDGGLMAVI